MGISLCLGVPDNQISLRFEVQQPNLSPFGGPQQLLIKPFLPARPGPTRAVVGDPQMEWNLFVRDLRTQWNLFVRDTKTKYNLALGTPKRSKKFILKNTIHKIKVNCNAVTIIQSKTFDIEGLGVLSKDFPLNIRQKRSWETPFGYPAQGASVRPNCSENPAYLPPCPAGQAVWYRDAADLDNRGPR